MSGNVNREDLETTLAGPLSILFVRFYLKRKAASQQNFGCKPNLKSLKPAA